MKSLKMIYFILLLATTLNILTGCWGRQGEPGQNGQSCNVTQLENGAEIKCGNQTTAVVLNGTNGVNGIDGKDLIPSAYSIIAEIDPCGKQSNFDEVILRLSNGKLLGHYSEGNKQFLTFLGPGNYITTDGTNCRFSVNSNLNVTF